MFVFDSNTKIDQRISNDMMILVKKILSKFVSVKSIFLVGGFGRDEGSLINYKDKIQPINDYDLVVIGDCWVKGCDKDLFRKELAESVKSRQVDIVLIKPNKLKRLKFTMFNYDLKYASKLIYGSNTFLDNISSWNPHEMPIIEGVKPLFLFLSSLLQAYPETKNLDSDDIFWSYQQLTKSILGWSTAMIIFEGLYDASYIKRNKIFQEKFSHEVELCRMVDQATQFKINSQANIYNQKEIKDFWLDASSAHLKVSRSLLQRYYKIKNNSWAKIVLIHRFSLINVIKYIYSIAFMNPHYRNCLNTDIAKLYLCLGLVEKKNMFINKSKSYYKKLTIRDNSSPIHMSDEEYLDFLIKTDINSQLFYSNDNKVFYE